jgi:hypothetical protein
MAFFDPGRRNKGGSRLIYLFDMSRGVEVLRLDKGSRMSATMRTVKSPKVKRDRFAAKPIGGLEVRTAADGSTSYVCPLFQ